MCGRWVSNGWERRETSQAHLHLETVCVSPPFSKKGQRIFEVCRGGWKGWWNLRDSKEPLNRQFFCVFEYLPKSRRSPLLFWLAWFGFLARKECKCSSPSTVPRVVFCPQGNQAQELVQVLRRWSSQPGKIILPIPHCWARVNNKEESHPTHVHVSTSCYCCRVRQQSCQQQSCVTPSSPSPVLPGAAQNPAHSHGMWH